MTSDTQSTDLGDAVQILRRRWKLALLSVATVLALVACGSLLQTERYDATAKLLFRDPGFDQRLFGAPVSGGDEDPDRAAQTNLELVSLQVVAQRAAQALPELELDEEAIERKVDVIPEGRSNVISIVAHDEAPEAAQKLADAFASEFVRFRREADQAKIADASALVAQELRTLQREGGVGRETRLLQRQLSELKTLRALQTGNAEVVQRAALPDRPAAPNYARNLLLGLGLGCILAAIAVFFRERFDNRLRNVDEVETVAGAPVLATIPFINALTQSGTSPAREMTDSERRSYWMLHSQLRYFHVDRDLRSLIITSSAPGDGKSTIGSRLAMTSAALGQRVLLLEADMHHNEVARQLDLRSTPGLAELLSHQAELHDAIQRVSIDSSSAGANATGLDVIVGGHTPPNPLQLTSSETMADLLANLEHSYDLIIVDSPPISMLADAIPLVPKVSGVLLIARDGETTRDKLAALRDQIQSLKGTILGVVLNAHRSRDAEYYGYYSAGKPGERLERSVVD